jgi:hypothetical protein
MNGSCRKATLVTIGFLIAAALLTGTYIWDCHRRGEADYLAISQSREPMHASPGFPIADGGSTVYYGRGYRVKRLRRIIPYQFGEGFGYIVGGELKWDGLARAFLRDEDYIRYIEPPQIATNQVR